MLKINKMLFLGASFSALSALCFIPISCSAIEQDKQDIKIWRNYGPHAVPYQFDNSWNTVDSSIVNQDIGNKLDVNLFRIQTLGKLEINSKTKKIITPSFSRYKFEYAKSINFVFKNAKTNEISEIVFDSDDVNSAIKNNRLQINKQTNLPFGIKKEDINSENFILKSNNKASINSNYFKTVAKGNYFDSSNRPNLDFQLIFVNIAIKSNIPWIKIENNNGIYSSEIWKDKNNNPAYVCAKDFYYSFIRSYLFSQNNRWSNLGGGSEQIDKQIIKKLGHVHKYGKHDRFETEGLIENFGFSLDKLLDQNQTLANKKNQQEFRIYTNTNAEHDFGALFDSLFVNNSVFSAAPSRFIDQKRDANDFFDFGQKGLAKQVLYYSYASAKDGSDALYASSYIPSKYLLLNEKYLEFRKNKHYVDLDFVNADDNLKVIGIQYSDSQVLDDSVKIQSLVSSFLSDNYSILDLYYDDLPTSIKQQLSTSISYVSYNKKELMGSFLPTVVPAPKSIKKLENENSALKQNQLHHLKHHHEDNHNHEHNEYDYSYNNSYALLLWNSSIEQLSKGNSNQDMFSSYFLGLGLHFRNAIQAAINWKTFASEVSNSTGKEWFSILSPNASIGGYDQASSQIKKLRDDYNNLNRVKLVNSNYFQDSETNLKNSSLEISQRYKSSIYDLAKTRINKILDEFIKSSNKDTLALLEKEKENGKYTFQWTLFCHSWDGPTSSRVIKAHEQIASLVSSLSNKYNLKITIKIPTIYEAHELLKSGLSSSTRYKPAYKYDGIGSGLELLALNNTTGILPALSLYSDLSINSENIKDFPEFKVLSDQLKGYLNPFINNYNQNQNNLEKKIKPFQNWYHYSNAKWNNQLETFDEKNSGLFAKISVFFHNYQKRSSNQDLIKLAIELNMLVGNSLEMTHRNSHYIDANKYSKIIINADYIYPSVPSGTIFYEDIIIEK